MKPIRSVLKMVTRQGAYDIPAVDKFLKSVRGEKFILKLGIKNISILEKEMHAPKLNTVDPVQRQRLWINRAKKLGLLPDKVPLELRERECEANIRKGREKAKNGELKLTPRLTHYQIQKSFIKKKVLSPIMKEPVAKRKNGQVVWEHVNHVYRTKVVRVNTYSTRKGLLGSEKINGYIDHSVEKWIRKNPQPMNYGPLFGDQVAIELANWKTRQKVYREYIAKVMTERYGHETTKKKDQLRLFATHKNGDVVYDNECTEPIAWGYPMLGLSISDDIKSKLGPLFTKHSNDTPKIIKFSVYTNRGSLVYQQAA